MTKNLWIACGAVIVFTTLSLGMAAVPSSHTVTDDTALYQKLSEIKVSRESRPNFDSDINRLASMEHAYRERLPTISKRVASRRFPLSPRKKNVATN